MYPLASAPRPPSRVWASLSMLRPIGIAIWEGIAAVVTAAMWLTARLTVLKPALTCGGRAFRRGFGSGVRRVYSTSTP